MGLKYDCYFIPCSHISRDLVLDYLLPLISLILLQDHANFNYYAFQYVLMFYRLTSLHLFFFLLKLVLASHFSNNFRTSLSLFLACWNFDCINFIIILVKPYIFTILILPIQEHDIIIFRFFMSFNKFGVYFQFSSDGSYTFTVTFTLKHCF